MVVPAEQKADTRTFAAIRAEGARGIAMSATIAVAAYFAAPQLARFLPITSRSSCR
jgi:hypothetical protein